MKSFLGLPDANEKVLHLAKIMTILGPLANFTFVLSTTFYVVFVAGKLAGNDANYLQGMGLVGILVVVQMVVQTLLDYPTGAIGDWIGQRWVIASAQVCYAISFFMISFVTYTTPFLYLVAIYALTGLAQSQASGAWNAWFDNNYRAAMPGDTDRKQYGTFWGRMGMMIQIVATASLIPGSILAVVISREWVFQFQAVLAILLSIATFILVRDFPEVEEQREARPDMSEYLGILKGGVSFLFKYPYVRYIVVGGMLATSSIMVWGNLILFPMYYGYLITDVAVASFRTLLFTPGIFAQERSGVWSRRFEPKKWIPRFRLIQTCGFVFFWVFATIMYLFPPASADSVHVISINWPFTEVQILTLPLENLLPIALIFSTFVLTSFFGGFAEILTQRVLLDVIPNKIRNSMYSLAPTIATIFAIPQIALFGYLLTIIGFPLTLMSCGVISAMGVILIVRGFKHERPIIEGTWSNNGDSEVAKEEEIEEMIDEKLLTDIEAFASFDEE
jgi:MFS family permease